MRERPDLTVFPFCGSPRCRIERRHPPVRAIGSMTGTGRFHRNSAHYSGVKRRRSGQNEADRDRSHRIRRAECSAESLPSAFRQIAASDQVSQTHAPFAAHGKSRPRRPGDSIARIRRRAPVASREAIGALQSTKLEGCASNGCEHHAGRSRPAQRFGRLTDLQPRWRRAGMKICDCGTLAKGAGFASAAESRKAAGAGSL